VQRRFAIQSEIGSGNCLAALVVLPGRQLELPSIEALLAGVDLRIVRGSAGQRASKPRPAKQRARKAVP
jgi:hypothetical protein